VLRWLKRAKNTICRDYCESFIENSDRQLRSATIFLEIAYSLE